MFVRAYQVAFEANGEGTMEHHRFPTKAEAVRYAKTVTTDGTAWPEQAEVASCNEDGDPDYLCEIVEGQIEHEHEGVPAGWND